MCPQWQLPSPETLTARIQPPGSAPRAPPQWVWPVFLVWTAKLQQCACWGACFCIPSLKAGNNWYLQNLSEMCLIEFLPNLCSITWFGHCVLFLLSSHFEGQWESVPVFLHPCLSLLGKLLPCLHAHLFTLPLQEKKKKKNITQSAVSPRIISVLCAWCQLCPQGTHYPLIPI